MPSSLFHAAIGALIGLASLDEDLDKWALLAILTAALLPDVDSFIALWVPGAHRTVLHNIFVFLIPAAVLFYATRVRDTEFFDRHWPGGAKVLWICILVVAVAGIGLDVFGSGANLLYPVQDQYYHFSGEVTYSSEQGLVNTLFEVEEAKQGSSDERYYATGIDRAEQLAQNDGGQGGDASTATDRRFPLFGNGIQLILSLTAFGIVLYRMHQHGHTTEELGVRPV